MTGMYDWLAPKDAAERLGISYQLLLKLSRRPNDPFPIRVMPGNSKHGVVNSAEADEWMMRNTHLR